VLTESLYERRAKVTEAEHDRDVGLRIIIDTNVINARGRDVDMNQLEAWATSGAIDIVLPETAHGEASAGGDVRRVGKANTHVVSASLAQTPEERRVLQQIGQAIFPDVVPNRNQTNDIDIVFNAWKYGAILVTNDGDSRTQPRGILGSRTELAALAIRVMRPAEAVLEVRRRITVRDDNARQAERSREGTLPEWVGQD
jgi:predicted nuclease of predicted toxin-antitoxin system